MRFRFFTVSAVCVAAASGFVLTGTSAFGAKTLDACKVLTSADISAAFDDAPLDGVPIPTTPIDPNASSCRYENTQLALHSLRAEVTLTPGSRPFRASSEGYTALTKKELKPLGADSGWVYIHPTSQGTGAITVWKGKTKIYIRAGYSGGVPVPTVDRTGYLTLAAKVAKQV